MLEFVVCSDTVLFRLADGTIKKFVVQTDYDTIVMREEETTIHDLCEMGDITDEEYCCITQAKRAKRQAVKEEQHLMTAWRNHYAYGLARGFPKPTVYPQAVQKHIAAFEWTTEERRTIMYKDIRFVIKRPK